MATKVKAKLRAIKRPLEGIRVLDLTQNANGPFGTQILGLLGAEIIKIEPPGGQLERINLSKDPNLVSTRFIMLNHSKKGITLNLKTELGLELFKEMVKKADVVVENMRLGTAERIGVGYEELRKINPRLIYASSKGYGRTGRYKHVLAFDATVQAMGGAMSVNGLPGNPPCKVGPAIGDWCTSVYTALGIISALRMRDITGKGQMVETSMQESVIAFTLDHQQIYLEHGTIPGRGGNNPYRIRPDLENPKGIYEAKDGYVYIAASQDRQWEPLLKVLGREDLLEHPEFKDRFKRFEQVKEIDEMIETWTRQHTREEVMDIMGHGEVPCGAVRNVKEVLEDPDLNQKKFFRELDHPQRGKVKVFGLPIQFSQAPSYPETPCPSPGMHNEAVYGEWLGYGKDELAELQTQGVI